MVLEAARSFSAANAETLLVQPFEILEDTGIVDVLCFGSESGNLASLQAAKLMSNETEVPLSFKSQFRRRNVLSFGTCQSFRNNFNINCEILSQPNHILALEYLKALEHYHCRMIPMTIKKRVPITITLP